MTLYISEHKSHQDGWKIAPRGVFVTQVFLPLCNKNHLPVIRLEKEINPNGQRFI